jgi:hypothetical protein
MKKKLLLTGGAALLGLGALMAQMPEAKLVWATDKVFDVPESALYADSQNLIFISNISGKPDEKDGKGFISTLSLSGKMFNSKWVEGLNAPKGMAVCGKKLYVSDVTDLVEIEINERKITNRFEGAGSIFLNDVAVSGDSSVFVSDMKTQSVYRFKNGVFAKWLTSDALANVNGLTVVGDTLFAGVSNAILSITLPDAVVSVWASGTGGIDGLEWDGIGSFVFSDWQGHTYKISKGGKPVLLLDTTSENVGAADIGFNKQKRIVYIPTFFDNRVTAYEIK